MDRSKITQFARRLVLLAVVWWLLAGGDASSWVFGGPVVVAISLWAHRLFSGPARLRPARLGIFIPYFVWRSLMGSVDVAWRALDRRLPIAPAMYRYPLRLPADGPGRVFFANCLNLLPGTLAASWEDDVLHVHVLAEGHRVMADLRELERQVALLFGRSTGDRFGRENS